MNASSNWPRNRLLLALPSRNLGATAWPRARLSTHQLEKPPTKTIDVARRNVINTDLFQIILRINFETRPPGIQRLVRQLEQLVEDGIVLRVCVAVLAQACTVGCRQRQYHQGTEAAAAARF